MKNLGETLKQWRARLHISQAQAAERLGVSKDTLQNWEQGRYLPDPLRAEAVLARMDRAGLSGGQIPAQSETRLPARAARTIAQRPRRKKK